MKNIFLYPLFSIGILIFYSCTGPRNLYSVSPLISPVQLKKGAATVEASYLTHSKYSVPSKSADNGFAASISHMPGKKILAAVSVDLKRDRDVFIKVPDSFQRLIRNGGFDSSIVNTKRSSASLSMVYFFRADHHRSFVPSIGASLGLHHMQLAESGQLKNNGYQRFFNDNQLSFSLQYNMLFKIGRRINLAYIGRLTIVKFLTPETDYTKEEGFNSGLNRSKKIEFYPGFFGGYADYRPFKYIPFYITGQFFNDLAVWEHVAAKFDPNRTNVKGSGLSVGLRYIF
jgi:hypothetical protein